MYQLFFALFIYFPYCMNLDLSFSINFYRI